MSEHNRAVARTKARKMRPYYAKYRRERRKTDINYRLRTNLSGRIYSLLKGRNKSASTMKLLGCSIESFRLYLESRFEEGMSWDNYSKFGWHIDHIIPCAIFDLTKPEHQKRCFHFSNMQPMWATPNHSKGCKYSGELVL